MKNQFEYFNFTSTCGYRGCTSENNDNGTTSSSIEVSVTSDSATNLTGDTVDIVRTEGNNTNFKVEQKKGNQFILCLLI